MSTEPETNRPSWELPDAVWQRMAPLIPPQERQGGAPAHGKSSTHDRSDLLRPADRDPMASLSPGTLWPAQHRLLLLCAVGTGRRLGPVVGRSLGGV
jgi:hypothetical protein